MCIILFIKLRPSEIRISHLVSILRKQGKILSDFLEGFPETTQMLPELFLNTRQFHKHKQQETQKKIQEPTKDTNMPKQNKTPTKKVSKFVTIRVSGRLS